MANWTNTSKAYLSGTITSSLVLDSANVSAGSIPSSWNTYNDGTYNDSTYTPTACFNGQVDSGIGRPRMFLTQAGGSGDIKYRFRTSPTGSVWGSWSLLTNAYGKDYIDSDNRWIDLEVIYYSPLWSDSDYFGIQTIGAQFIRFNKYETIYAEDMNSNFNYLGGNRLPYGGLYLLPTNSIYNLGSDIYYFNVLYVNSISSYSIKNFNSDIMHRLVYGINLSAAASSIEVTGLNLSTYSSVEIGLNIVGATTSNIFYLIINGDSASNYGYQRLVYCTSGSTTRDTGTSIILGSSYSQTSYYNIKISTRDGLNKTVLIHGMGDYNAGITSTNGIVTGAIWNSSSTITSFKIYSNTTAACMLSGTSLYMWRTH